MKRPAFQFYPDNWRNNSNLRRCSWAARGVWVEIICLMHDSDQYGVLRWTMKEIAQALGCPMPALKELVAKGVMKGCDAGECEPYIYTPRSGRKDGEPVTLVPVTKGPIWYSSRMVRDEHVRMNAGAATRFGSDQGGRNRGPSGSPQTVTNPPERCAPKTSPTRRQGEDQSDGSSSSSPPSEEERKSSETTSRAGEAPPSPAATAPPDARSALWTEGLGRLRRLTGKPDKGARALLGQLCREAGDDCALISTLLHEAEAGRYGDPIPWLQAAVKTRMGHRDPARKPTALSQWADLMSPQETAFDFDGHAEEIRH